MTLTLEGPPRNDGPSWASVRIENTGERGIRWAGGGCGDPGGIYIDLHEVFPAGRMDWPGRLGVFKRRAVGPDPGSALQTLGYIAEARWGTDLACSASLRIETLPAHESLFLRAGWDGTYEGTAVPTGPARVEAVLPVIGIEGEVDPMDYDSHPVAVSARTTIVGGDGGGLLAPALAIDAALADPQFAAWVQAADPATWINPDVARIEGGWSVGLFRNGPDHGTLFGQVRVDGNSRVVARRFEP
jgi:hypothetical protein